MEDSREVIHKLNQDLLLAAENPEIPPNPSIYIALRLSNQHNLLIEGEYLEKLKTEYYNDIQRDLNKKKPVTGRLALYVMALRSSCDELNNVSLTTGGESEPLLTHLKRQMELEKDNIAIKERPLTDFYQYSLGILALCVSDESVSSDVSQKLIDATLNNRFIWCNSKSVETAAMAGMALQCLKESRIPFENQQKLVQALDTIKNDLLQSKQADGHFGNKLSTGLAVQALLAMGYNDECTASINAMLSDATRHTYQNTVMISKILPALQRRSYVHLKNIDCVNEDDTLTPVSVEVEVEVVKADGSSVNYNITVLSGISLLQTLKRLQKKEDFTFETTRGSWGQDLIGVNGERAEQSDTRYWHIASNGRKLGLDYKIKAPEMITFTNKPY